MSDRIEKHRDALVAAAFDRVLDAEREARAAIEACERQKAQQLEQARQKRRLILDRAQARIVALHGRASQALSARSAQIAESGRLSAQQAIEQLADPARHRDALECLTARLTSGGDE